MLLEGIAVRALLELRLGLAVGAQRVGVLDERPALGVRLEHVDLGAHRVDRAATEAAPDRGEQGGLTEVAGRISLRLLGEQEHGEVGRDGVVAARRHDLGAGISARARAAG